MTFTTTLHLPLARLLLPKALLPLVEALGYNDGFRRLWKFHLAYCEGGFRARCIDIHQVALVVNP